MLNVHKYIILFLLWFNGVLSVKVKTREGWLEGQFLTTSTGKVKFYSFKSIPYAAPPIGDLRFKAPQPPFKWDGIRKATKHGPVCVQFESMTSGTIIGDEDCLFLNVYSPNINPRTLLPVMFFIFGGLFELGSGNDDFYAPDFLMECGVVLVTLNFRVGALGFLSVNNKEASGNAGLKDQIAALQWIQRNIRSFGGDPNIVTIFGSSSGASCVTLHMLSPAAKGLFHRAIPMSGVYSKDFGIGSVPEEQAFAIGRKLGLETRDTNTLVDYLRSVPAENLTRARPDVFFTDQATAGLLTMTYFTPVVEQKFGDDLGQYLTESPIVLMKKGQVNKVDLLMGHAAEEGLRLATFLDEYFLHYFPQYKEFLVPQKISYCASPLLVSKIADEIQDFYFGDQPICLESFENLVTYYSHSRYLYEIFMFLERWPELRSRRRYFYKFGIYSERNIHAKAGAQKFGIKRATHSDDLAHMFDGLGYNVTVDVNGEIYKYVQLVTKLFTNFAKFGTPTPDDSLGLVWPEYGPGRNYVAIGETGNLTIETVSYETNTFMDFWHQLHSRFGCREK